MNRLRPSGASPVSMGRHGGLETTGYVPAPLRGSRAAPFLCFEGCELLLLSRRISLAMLLAGLSFLLFPLTLQVERAHAEGMVGAVLAGSLVNEAEGR